MLLTTRVDLSSTVSTAQCGDELGCRLHDDAAVGLVAVGGLGDGVLAGDLAFHCSDELGLKLLGLK